MIINGRSTDYLVSIEVIQKLKLQNTKLPIPYKFSWLQNGHQLLVSEQCEIDLQIGNHKDKLLCDVMPMDVFNILLGRPWQYDKNARHDGRKNIYELENDGIKHKLIPLQENGQVASSRTLLLGGKEFLEKLRKEEVSYSIMCKLSNNEETYLSSLPIELQDMMGKFGGIIVHDFPNELPPMRNISHHMDFILGMSFPNKASYKMTPQENDEIRKHVQGLLEKGLSLRPCVVPTVLTPNKDGKWRMCTYSRAIKKITRYKFPLP